MEPFWVASTVKMRLMRRQGRTKEETAFPLFPFRVRERGKQSPGRGDNVLVKVRTYLPQT